MASRVFIWLGLAWHGWMDAWVGVSMVSWLARPSLNLFARHPSQEGLGLIGSRCHVFSTSLPVDLTLILKKLQGILSIAHRSYVKEPPLFPTLVVYSNAIVVSQFTANFQIANCFLRQCRK